MINRLFYCIKMIPISNVLLFFCNGKHCEYLICTAIMCRFLVHDKIKSTLVMKKMFDPIKGNSVTFFFFYYKNMKTFEHMQSALKLSQHHSCYQHPFNFSLELEIELKTLSA